MTRNGDFYGIQMAEYVLGYIIYNERQLIGMKTLQEQRLWSVMSGCVIF